jgi:hypothetical protein
LASQPLKPTAARKSKTPAEISTQEFFNSIVILWLDQGIQSDKLIRKRVFMTSENRKPFPNSQPEGMSREQYVEAIYRGIPKSAERSSGSVVRNLAGGVSVSSNVQSEVFNLTPEDKQEIAWRNRSS